MQILKLIAPILTLLGGLNLVVIGTINVDLIAGLLGHSKIGFIIEIITGLSAIYTAIILLNKK